MSRTTKDRSSNITEDGSRSSRHVQRERRRLCRELGPQSSLHSLRPRLVIRSGPRQFERNGKRKKSRDSSVRSSSSSSNRNAKMSLRPFKELRALLEGSVITEKDLLNADGLNTRTRLQRAQQRPEEPNATSVPEVNIPTPLRSSFKTRIHKHHRKTKGGGSKKERKLNITNLTLDKAAKKKKSYKKEPVVQTTAFLPSSSLTTSSLQPPPLSLPSAMSTSPQSSHKTDKMLESCEKTVSCSLSFSTLKNGAGIRRSKRLATLDQNPASTPVMSPSNFYADQTATSEKNENKAGESETKSVTPDSQQPTDRLQPGDVENTVILDHAYSKPLTPPSLTMSRKDEMPYRGRGCASDRKKSGKHGSMLDGSRNQDDDDDDDEDDDDDDDDDDEDENLPSARVSNSYLHHNKQSLMGATLKRKTMPGYGFVKPTYTDRNSALPSSSRQSSRCHLSLKKANSQSKRRVQSKDSGVAFHHLNPPIVKVNSRSHNRSSSGACSLLRSCRHAKCLKAKREKYSKKPSQTECGKDIRMQDVDVPSKGKSGKESKHWKSTWNSSDGSAEEGESKRRRVDEGESSEEELKVRRGSQVYHHSPRGFRGKQFYELGGNGPVANNNKDLPRNGTSGKHPPVTSQGSYGKFGGQFVYPHSGPAAEESVTPGKIMKELELHVQNSTEIIDANNVQHEGLGVDNRSQDSFQTPKETQLVIPQGDFNSAPDCPALEAAPLDSGRDGLKYFVRGNRRHRPAKSNDSPAVWKESPSKGSWTQGPDRWKRKTGSISSGEINNRWAMLTPEQQNASIKCWTYLLQLALGPGQSKEFWEEVEKDFFKTQVKYIRHQNERDWPVDEEYLAALRYGVIWKHVRWYHGSVIKQLRRKMRQLTWLPAAERYIWAKQLELAKCLDALVTGGRTNKTTSGNDHISSPSNPMRLLTPIPRPIMSPHPSPAKMFPVSPRLTEVLQTIEEVEQQLDLAQSGKNTSVTDSYDIQLLEDIIAKLQGSSMEMMPLGGKHVMVPVPTNQELCEALLRDVHLSWLPLEVIEEYLPESVGDDCMLEAPTSKIGHSPLGAGACNWDQVLRQDTW